MTSEDTFEFSGLEEASLLDAYNFGYLFVPLSTLVFFFNNHFILTRLIPLGTRTSKQREWKWKNIANSFTHSLITGCGSCLCFWWTPCMMEDLIEKYSHSSHILVSLSIGYFFWDLVDMFLNEKSKLQKYELLLHHLLVILCFSVAVTQKLFMGYALMALLLEVNSIFLHVRQLMIIQQWNKQSPVYRINNTLNLGTFILFRILTLGWMTRWLLQRRNVLTTVTFNLAGISLAAIMWMNIALLQRILNSDYRKRSKPLGEENLKTKSGKD